MSQRSTADDLLKYVHRCDARGWVANHDGNGSIRLSADRFLATPTGLAKGDIERSDLVVCDLSGTVISGSNRLFSEWNLHRNLYEERPDVNAVLHSHSPFATAFGAARKDVPHPFLPEAVVSIGPEVPRVSIAPPGSDAVVAFNQCINRGQVFIVEGNGVFSVGKNMEQAYLRMELLEHVCRIAHVAHSMGGVQLLDEALTQALTAKHIKAGLAAPHYASSRPAQRALELTEKVKDKLGGRGAVFSTERFEETVRAVVADTLSELGR